MLAQIFTKAYIVFILLPTPISTDDDYDELENVKGFDTVYDYDEDDSNSDDKFDAQFIMNMNKEATGKSEGPPTMMYANKFEEEDLDKLNYETENIFRSTTYVKPQTRKQKNFLLGLINHIRRSVGASNMNYMRWSHVAETVAIQMSKQRCKIKTDKNLIEIIDVLKNEYSVLERDVYINSWTKIMKESFVYWTSGSDYYRQNMCELRNRDLCVKYLTMVWHSTEDIGCTYRVCPKDVNPMEDKVHILCLFYPKGEYLQQPAFILGRPCARCNVTNNCFNDLCVRGTADLDSEDYIGYRPSNVNFYRRDMDLVVTNKETD